MKKLALLALLTAASLSFGKGWIQEWTPKFPSWTSTVEACKSPTPLRRIVMDDFEVYQPYLTTINWWGTVSHPKQVEMPYYIAIYPANRNCTPSDVPVWQSCVKAQTDLVGVDCQGKDVYKFRTQFAWGDINIAPGRYWIQISEVDKDSYKPDQFDFAWSSHSGIVDCPAMAVTLRGIIQPLIDPCYEQKVDLAFEVW